MKDGIVNAEVVSTDTEGMLREGRELASWHSNIVVKVPMTPAGVRALHVLHGEGIRINVTLVFSAAQALLVAKAGAYFVSPFLGRLDDTAQDGLHVLSEIMDIYRAYQFPTQVLAASLRGPLHVVEAARMGVHIGTMPFKVFEQLFKHPLTDVGLASFLKDWQRRGRYSATSSQRRAYKPQDGEVREDRLADRSLVSSGILPTSDEPQRTISAPRTSLAIENPSCASKST